MLELAPAGFAEEDGAFVVFTDEEGVSRLTNVFGDVDSHAVAPGWEDEWRRFHTPVVVGSLWIGPPWLEPTAGLIEVSIDPGRAFGTGAHETTRLCLELLLACRRGGFLDLGCGSGVLAIAAAKLGFQPVAAIDVEDAAVEAARRNAAANGVTLDVRQGDATSVELPAAAVAAANVTLEAVESIAARLEVEHLITSGYLASARPRLAGYRHLARRSADCFAADLYTRQ